VTTTPTKNNKTPSYKKLLLKPWVWVPLALILILGIILTQVDLESVKENLVQRISQETGLKVEIDSMGFGFSHGLGLQGKGVKVSTPEGHRFSVDRLYLLAELKPLLLGEIKIKSAALEHPEVTLEIFESAPEQPPVEKTPEEPTAELIDPNTLQSATDKFKSTPLSIEKFIISDGKITLIRSGTTNQTSFNVDGTIVMNQEESLDISAKSVKVQTGSIIFEGEVIASNLTADNAGLSVSLKSNGFSRKELQPILNFFGDSAKVILAPLKAIDVEQLLLKAELPVNSLSRVDTLQQEMTGHFELKTQNTVLKMGDKSYSIEYLNGEGTWDKGVLKHNISSKILGSDLNLSGNFPFADLENESISRLEWKNLSLEKLPLEKGLAWRPTQGKVSGSVSLTGPLPNDKETFPGRLKAIVDFQAEGLVLKPENAEEASPITLSHLQGHGDFKNGQLKHEIKGTLWGSEFDIQGNFPVNQPVLDERINWTGLDIAQLPLPSNPGWNPTEGKLSGTLILKGPAPVAGESFPGKLKASLEFEAQNLKLQSKDSPTLSINQLGGSGNIENNQLNYKLKGDPFNGTFQSDGRITLPASGSSPIVLNNQVKFANLDLTQLPTAEKLEKGNASGTIQLNGPLPDAGDFLTGKLKIDTAFKVTGLTMANPPLEIQSLEGKGILKKGALTHDLDGILYGGKAKVKGTLVFKQNKDQTLITANSNLALDQFKLDWVPLVHTSEWGPTSGTITGNLSVKGPLPTDGNISPALKLKGILNGDKLVLGGPQKQIEKAKLEFKESASKLPLVQVEIEQIKLDDRRFKKIMAQFQISPKKIDLGGGRIWPMNGLLKLAGDFKPKTGNYSLRFKGDELKVEEFLSPHLTGPLQLSGALVGALPQNTDAPGMPDYARDLSGNIKLKLVNGTLPELGTLKNVLTLLNPTSALGDSTKGLACDLLQGDFKIVKGVVNTSNLEMKSPQITLAVEGQANLVEDSINAQVKAMPLQMLDKTLKAIPLLGKILTGGKKGGLIETYFKVDGKLSQPDVAMQPHKSLLKKPGSILNELIKIPGNLGGK
jgi:uncharacterized protein involved in outer membrane biogenesis